MPLTQVKRFKKNIRELLKDDEKEFQNAKQYEDQQTRLNSDANAFAPATLSFYIPTQDNAAEIEPAQPVQAQEQQQNQNEDSRSVKKKRKEMQKQYTKALKSKLNTKNKASYSHSNHFMAYWEAEKIIKDGYYNHDSYDEYILNETLKSINEIEKSNLAILDYDIALKKQNKEAAGTCENSVEAKTLKIRLDAQNERITAYKNRAKVLLPDSKEREKMMEKVEEETLKADHLEREYKVACMPEGAEKQRDAATIKRHDRFDFLKKLFRTPTKYSKADAALNIPANQALDIQQDLKLVNAGRATMGGTKAMYTFVDYNNMQTVNGEDVPQEWLFKEATNCIGRYKPEGAVVTEEASRLQTFMRGELSIPAYCVKDGDKVVGSVQKKIQAVDGGVDLFKWQAQNDLTQNPPSKTTLDDLMNEHTLDWLLCNFDTKGENFINQADGHIISFDKEASFNHLLDGEAQQMSYNYKPHSNDTIYNTMFKAYAEGNIDLDLDANLDSILKIEEKLRLDKENAGVDGAEPSYVEMFKNTLDAKYGAEVTGQRIDAAIRLRDRAANLRETYRTFYTELITQRLEKLAGKPEKAKEYNQLRSRIQNGKFEFADERAQRLEDEFNDKVVSEREAELETIRKASIDKKNVDISDIINSFDANKAAVEDCIQKNNLDSLDKKRHFIKDFDEMKNILNENIDTLDAKTAMRMRKDINKYEAVVEESRKFYMENIPKVIQKQLNNIAPIKADKLNINANEKFNELYGIYQNLLANIKDYDYNGRLDSIKKLCTEFKQYDSLMKYFDNIKENLTNEFKEFLINKVKAKIDIVPELRESLLDMVNKFEISCTCNDEEKLEEVRSSRDDITAFYNPLLENEQEAIKSQLRQQAKLKSSELNEKATERFNRLYSTHQTLYGNMKNYDYDGTLLDSRESLLNLFKKYDSKLDSEITYFKNASTDLNDNLKKFLTDIVDDITSDTPEIRESLLNEIKKYGTFWSHGNETNDKINEMLSFKDEIADFYNLLAQEQA